MSTKQVFTVSLGIVVALLLASKVWANERNPAPVAVIASPANNAVVYDGEPVSLSANGSQANGAPSMTYRWRVLPSGGFWIPVCGPTTSSTCKNKTYTFPALGAGVDEKQYTVELQVVTAYGSSTKTVQVTLKRYRERSYYLTDHLGSIRTTVDMDGNVKGYDDYYPFGLPMTGHSSNSSNPNDDNKFTGYEKEDEGNLNLYHANARGYDPILGRFNQVDPHSASYPDFSPYTYTMNNPMNLIDPDGQDVRITWEEDEEGNITVILSTTVIITGDGANEKLANQFNKAADKYLNGESFSADGVTVKFDVNYEYEKNATVADLKNGDNLLEFSNNQKSNKSVSHVNGRATSTTVDGVDFGTQYYSGNTGVIFKGDHRSNYTILHETLHFVGLSDRYTEGIDWMGNRVTTPLKGYSNDIMGDNSFKLNATHINNIVDYSRTYMASKSGITRVSKNVMDRYWNGKLIPWRN